MDLEWILDTPADEYEVGEELYFRTSTWSYVTGLFVRQMGEYTVVKCTEVMWGSEVWVGTEMYVKKEDLCEKINVESLFIRYDTYSLDYDFTAEELLEEDDNDIENPPTIGTVVTIGEGTYTIGKYTNRPRDGPTITTVKE